MNEISNLKTVIGRLFDRVQTGIHHFLFVSVFVVLNSLIYSIIYSWFFFKLVRTQVVSYKGKKFLAFHGFPLLAEASTVGIHTAVGPSAIHFTNPS